jgi:tRNA 2-thiouridine synthesizing protein A
MSGHGMLCSNQIILYIYSEIIMERIDARGLSCPQPVVLTKSFIDKTDSGEFEIIVDTGTARDNISRLAGNCGWAVTVRTESDDIVLTLKK